MNQPSGLQIVELARHPELLDEMAKLFFAEWHYLLPGDSTQQVIRDNLQKRMNADQIPVTYVTVDISGSFIGSISIKTSDMDTHPEFTPWLTGLYVKKEFRKRGIGSQLIEFLLQQAGKFNFTKLYLYTPSAEEYYKKRGWRLLSRETYMNCPVSIMEYTI